MVSVPVGIFRVILLTPKAKLLECRAGSLILPAHDGQRGILRNHCPMLAQLSMGIVQVRDITNREDAFYIVEGGFARVTENHVTILAYDVITFEGMKKKDIEDMVADARSIHYGKEYIRTQQGQVDAEKARYIVRMADLAKIEVSQTPES